MGGNLNGGNRNLNRYSDLTLFYNGIYENRVGRTQERMNFLQLGKGLLGTT